MHIQEVEMEWIYQFLAFGQVWTYLFLAGWLRAQFWYILHKGGAGRIPIHDEDDDEIMQLWIRGQGPNA
jgi:hypothetical protein